jgi:hypothetical protein
MKISKLISIISMAALSSVLMTANASQITQAEYDAASNLVNFNTIGNGTLIATQYTANGVTFSGQIAGQTSGDGVFSSTSANTYYAPGRTDQWGAKFSGTVSSVGFYAEYWQQDVITLGVYNNNVLLGTYNFNKPNNNIFSTHLIGVTDSNAFDEIRFSISGSSNHFFNMDDFKFQTATQQNVPEPTSIAMLGLGLAALAYRRRKSA